MKTFYQVKRVWLSATVFYKRVQKQMLGDHIDTTTRKHWSETGLSVGSHMQIAISIIRTKRWSLMIDGVFPCDRSVFGKNSPVIKWSQIKSIGITYRTFSRFTGRWSRAAIKKAWKLKHWIRRWEFHICVGDDVRHFFLPHFSSCHLF